jgi:uncharacterized membrane protein (DUF106 family)
MGIFSFIGDIFSPAVDLVDDLVVTDEERMALRNELASIQEKAQAKILELEKAKVEALANVQVAEASSEHFLVASWRPITILSLLLIILLGIFNVVTITSEQLDSVMELFKLVFGVYGTSRGIEKISKVVKFGK